MTLLDPAKERFGVRKQAVSVFVEIGLSSFVDLSATIYVPPTTPAVT